MFQAHQHHRTPVHPAPPRSAKDMVQRAPASRTNPAWHRLATSVHVSQPHDPAEREADRAADAVVRGQTATVHPGITAGASVQRLCAACEDEQHRRQEEIPVQAKRESGSTGPVTGDAGQLAGLERGGQPLPGALRSEFEPRFGHDFGTVRLHTDTKASESAQVFDALAYTYGRHVVFGAGQFDPASARGRRLIAHELAHVVQQSGRTRPALQRQGIGGPLDLKPDVCVTVPGLGTLCGQAAADACKKASWIPGCSLVCKVFDCSKPKEPKTLCPPGWRAATSKDFEGQCCQGATDSAGNCCAPDRIALFDNRCCGSDEVVVDKRCKKSKDLPPLPPDLLCPFGQRTLLGECCLPPMVSKGLECGLPDIKPPKPPPKPPQPALPKAIEIFFKLDRPREGETAAALTSVTTAEGKANFDALVASLKADPDSKVQLVGRASPEGTEAYNIELGARRARLVAAALKGAGIPESQIADTPVADLRAECQPLEAGLVTCGKAGATGARDREVMARVFQGGTP